VQYLYLKFQIMPRLLLFLFAVLFSFAGVSQTIVVPSHSDLESYGIDARGQIPAGLSLGSVAPEFRAVTVNGEKFSSAEHLRDKGLVVVFYRGTWSRPCMNYVKSLKDSIEMITSLGTEVIVISPEKGEFMKFGKQPETGMYAANDSNGAIGKLFNVSYKVSPDLIKSIATSWKINLSEYNDQDGVTLPVTATYVVHPSGKVTWRHFEYDPDSRPIVKDLIEEVRKLGLGEKIDEE
jgi:peroxiredoxin